MIKVAAGNHLTDYADAVIAMIWKDIPIILAFFLPAILICIFGRRIANYRKINLTLTGMTLALAVVTHLLGLAVLHMPWKGDLTPKMLYHMDTNVDDQVEQLGLLNMLRLDMKHMIIPPRNAMDDDFSGIGEFGGPDDTPETTPAGSDDIETSTEESTEDSGPVIDTSPNVMNIDLAKPAEETSNDDIKWAANYFNSITPTKKNEYTGMFEGYNLIEFVIEGFSGYVIDPILTPTLYKLSQEGFVFNNFYTPLHFTSTSNGECQTLLGLYPKNGFPTTMTRTGEIDFNPYFSLGRQAGRRISSTRLPCQRRYVRTSGLPYESGL